MNQGDDMPANDPPDGRTDAEMADADRANGEQASDEDAANDTEARYGQDESPA